jgi:hypothetical protein
MIPKGSVFFRLRQRVLDFYPEKCRILHKMRVTFTDWLQKGTYVPLSVTKSEIILEASPADISSIFLSDVEFFSNNCFEHIQECLCFSKDERIRSDAWNVVTIYYFSFFVAQALLRLLGKPLMFINKEALTFVGKITGSPSVPGSGVFYLEKIEDLSIVSTKYRLKSYRKRFHEATWKLLFGILNNILSEITSYKDAKELLFYEALTTKKLFKIYTDYQWPAVLRNRANYIPGFAYLLVEKKIVGKTRSLINELDGCEEGDILNLLNSSISSCSTNDDNEFSSHISLLHHTAHSLFILFRELYFELLDRRHLDRRMELKRKQFINKMDIFENASYPFMRTI